MDPRIGDLYGRAFSRAMERDVDPDERAALRAMLHSLGGEMRDGPSRQRRRRSRGLLAELIWEAIDQRLHGREED